MLDGTMDLAAEHVFEAPLERVVAMYFDEEFARERGLATGAADCEAVVDGAPDGAFTVVIRRTMPTDGVQPDFKPFIGPSISVRYTEAWLEPEGEGREATFAIDIVGVPARAAGTVSLTRHGETTALSVRGTISTRVPFLAGLVTQAVVDSVSEALDRELAAADRWLART